MKRAKEFRKWVFEEVLPSIRKNGYYVSSDISEQKIKQLEEELKEKETLLESKDALIEEKDGQLNRLHNIPFEYQTLNCYHIKKELRRMKPYLLFQRQINYHVMRLADSYFFLT